MLSNFPFYSKKGSRFKLTYDGMYHLDIPKTRQYDTGRIEVIARSSIGETLETCELKVVPRSDDYRGVLKNSPRRKCLLSFIFHSILDMECETKLLGILRKRKNSIITKKLANK